jgi:serine/threonine protein kinase
MENVQVIRKLGSGAQGTVSSCYLDGWICAMKEVHLFGENATREIDILSSLPSHPNIVRYLCHRSEPERIQLFLQQYSCSLSDLIRKRKEANARFTPQEILETLIDIAAGMKFLHSHKVIHRGTSTASPWKLTNRGHLFRLEIGEHLCLGSGKGETSIPDWGL